MQDAEVEVLLGCEVGHASNGHLLKRPVIRPFRKGAVDVSVMQCRLAVDICGYGYHFYCIPV